MWPLMRATGGRGLCGESGDYVFVPGLHKGEVQLRLTQEQALPRERLEGRVRETLEQQLQLGVILPFTHAPPSRGTGNVWRRF